MRLATLSTLVIALGLGACNAEPRQAAPVQTAGADVEHLRKMNDSYRNLSFRNAIRDSGARCERVTVSGYQQDFNKLSMWTARCTDSGDWGIFIDPKGYAQIHPCEYATTFAVPPCRIAAQSPSAPAEPAPQAENGA